MNLRILGFGASLHWRRLQIIWGFKVKLKIREMRLPRVEVEPAEKKNCDGQFRGSIPSGFHLNTDN
jgi:hypothetical protein